MHENRGKETQLKTMLTSTYTYTYQISVVHSKNCGVLPTSFENVIINETHISLKLVCHVESFEAMI